MPVVAAHGGGGHLRRSLLLERSLRQRFLATGVGVVRRCCSRVLSGLLQFDPRQNVRLLPILCLLSFCRKAMNCSTAGICADANSCPSRLDELLRELSSYDADFLDVRGQQMAKRAVTVATAGGGTVVYHGSNNIMATPSDGGIYRRVVPWSGAL